MQAMRVPYSCIVVVPRHVGGIANVHMQASGALLFASVKVVVSIMIFDFTMSVYD